MIKINDKNYREIRCPQCRKLLGYEYVRTGRLAFQCPRCGELLEFDLRELSKDNPDPYKHLPLQKK